MKLHAVPFTQVAIKDAFWTPPVTELRRADTGQKVLDLERADASALLSLGIPYPERFTAVVPGVGHGVAGTPYGRRRLQDFFVRRLLGVEPRADTIAAKEAIRSVSGNDDASSRRLGRPITKPTGTTLKRTGYARKKAGRLRSSGKQEKLLPSCSSD